MVQWYSLLQSMVIINIPFYVWSIRCHLYRDDSMDTLVVGMREGLGRGWDGRGIERSKVGRLEGREGRKRNREERGR